MIGKRIRARREELGLTQEELAKKLGYKSKSTINKIELDINDVSQSKLIKIASALGVEPTYFIDGVQVEIETPKPHSIAPAYLEKFYKLSAESQAQALKYIDFLLNQEGRI